MKFKGRDPDRHHAGTCLLSLPVRKLPPPPERPADPSTSVSMPSATSVQAPISILAADATSFAATVSPRSVDVEERLDLSLDALIKERRKENKLHKKQEEAAAKTKTAKRKHEKPPQTADKKKAVQQQQKQLKQQQQVAAVKTGQAEKRKAIVNKNRGLPSLPSVGKSNNNNKKHNKSPQGRGKTSIAATTAMLRRKMWVAKTTENSGRVVVSPKASKGLVKQPGQPAKKKLPAQQPRKVATQKRVVHQKQAKHPQPPVKNGTGQKGSAAAKTAVRQVARATAKKGKLQVTIRSSNNRNKAQRQQQKKTMTKKVLLPGKVSQALLEQHAASQKTAKRSKNRKPTATKATYVVRQSKIHRKKN